MSVLSNLAQTFRRGIAASVLSDADRAFLPFGPNGSASSFEGAGNGRRLAHFQPSRAHVNVAVQAAGRTLIKRARFMVENNGYAGNAVDVWAGWAIGDGIKAQIKNEKQRSAWRAWCKECDADGMTNFSGLQELAVREAYIAGEVFIRRRARRVKDMLSGIPFQMQILQSEMLDYAYNTQLESGNIVRLGIEFDGIGRRVAYHFWKSHPDDFRLNLPSGPLRVRVSADDVIHLCPGRQAGQIRGVSRQARSIVKLFMLDSYDDAELDRKRTASLFTAFITKTGEENPLDDEEDLDGDGDNDEPIQMAPGATVGLLAGEDVKIAQPAESGASYEPFQYRTLTQIAVALGVPYAYLTGDTTKGNFSNVRTEIMNFRRRIKQYQTNTFIPQFCDPVLRWFDSSYQLSPKYDQKSLGDEILWVMPKMDWVDPLKDVKADLIAVRSGFKSLSKVIGEDGHDISEIYDDIQASNTEADERGIILDSDPRRVSAAGMSNAMPPGSGFPDADDEILDPADNNDNSVIDPKGDAN